MEELDCGTGNDLLAGVKETLCDKVMRFQLDLNDLRDADYEGYIGNESLTADIDTLVLVISSRWVGGVGKLVGSINI